MRTPVSNAFLFGILLLAVPAGATTVNAISDTPLQLRLDGPLFALMQDDDLLGEDEGAGDVEEDAVERTEDAPPAAQVSESVGGAVGFVRSTGFYTASDLGGFIRFGGFAAGQECGGAPCVARVTSNLQPYIGLAVGYDILDWLGVQLSFGTGFVANAAVLSGNTDMPRDYGITFMNLAVLGSLWIDRFGIVGKVFGGGALVYPPPLPDAFPLGGNVGAGLGVRWATLLTDVTIGLDVNGYLAFAQAGGGMQIIPSLSFAPVIKYVF